MINVSYYKDFRHNYLIMEGNEIYADVYQRRMITDNRIEGLIPCQERHVNGDVFLYYEITSRQSLRSLYENRSITMKQLNHFFLQLKLVWEKISKFLLDENSLILSPEYIFTDVETEELSFLYYPFETDEKYMVSLLEFFADRVDGEDREAVEIVYKMLELATKEQFVLDEVLQWFEEDRRYEQRREEPVQETEEEDSFDHPEKEEGSGEKVKISDKVLYAGISLSVLAAGGLYCINSGYLLSEKLKIFLYAGFVFAGSLFLLCGGFLVFRKFLGKEDENEGKQTGKGEEKQEKLYREITDYEQMQEKAEPAYGNTVFIPWMENCENKLYGVGKGNKNHIDLSRLPLTVGKLAGSVDMVIEDQSISRRHAKFFREGNRVFMSDLNSTNGSFKNGMRLMPNDSEALEPGDEIRLGKLKFIYR